MPERIPEIDAWAERREQVLGVYFYGGEALWDLHATVAALLTVERERLHRVLAALDACERNRGRFSTVEAHDCRCPKSRAKNAEQWRESKCECGAEELDAAVAAAEAALREAK